MAAESASPEPISELAVCDSHIHCWDQLEKVSKFNNHVLGDCGSYLPEDYLKDMGHGNIKLQSCVHVEAFPTDQVQETKWIDSLASSVFPLMAIVANANLSLQKENAKSRSTQAEGMEALEDVLKRHKETSGRLRGIRWVLNHEPNWPQTYRGDYWTDPQFAAGYAKLEQYGLSFDLQCNPHQLKDAANFLKGFPNTPVVLNHVGCLKLEGEAAEQERALGVWREGMRAIASLPHVHCKLSMLSYTLPNYWMTSEGKSKAKQVVRESIEFFGPERCMFASNFPAEPEGACRELTYACFRDWVSDFPADVQEGLFRTNAERFYRITS